LEIKIMAYKHETNRGSLFKNEKKEKENQPDYTGKINVNGTLYNIAGWINQKNDKKYFGLEVSIPKPKEDKKPPSQDELPF
tara:strand:- start:263 stop:505 length:243 start_codon:yes stop_codon:yes gene_type:complete